jgi:hypothetical protein
MHSRVARSNAELWTKLGTQVTLCGPRTLLPPELEEDNVTLTTNIREAAEGAHAVMASAAARRADGGRAAALTRRIPRPLRGDGGGHGARLTKTRW